MEYISPGMIPVRKLDVMLFFSFEDDQDRAVSAHKELNNRLETYKELELIKVRVE